MGDARGQNCAPVNRTPRQKISHSWRQSRLRDSITWQIVLADQMGNTRLLVLQFLECLVDAFLAECVNWQALNHFVLAA